MENRIYESGTSKYKFTGKERDNESNYDYFGARYYDSRIANWTSTDPLFEKHFDYSPYNYVLRNPIVYIDPRGEQVRSYMIGGESLEESVYLGQYKELHEAGEESVQRETRRAIEWGDRPRETGAIETPFIDPVDIFSGSLGFKLAVTTAIGTTEKILLRGAAKKLTEEGAERISKKLIEETTEKAVEFLGKEVKVIPTKFGGKLGDKIFVSPTGKIRFDLKYFKPHDKPHIDIEILTKSGKWKNIFKKEF